MRQGFLGTLRGVGRLKEPSAQHPVLLPPPFTSGETPALALQLALALLASP